MTVHRSVFSRSLATLFFIPVHRNVDSSWKLFIPSSRSLLPLSVSSKRVRGYFHTMTIRKGQVFQGFFCSRSTMNAIKTCPAMNSIISISSLFLLGLLSRANRGGKRGESVWALAPTWPRMQTFDSAHYTVYTIVLYFIVIVPISKPIHSSKYIEHILIQLIFLDSRRFSQKYSSNSFKITCCCNDHRDDLRWR